MDTEKLADWERGGEMEGTGRDNLPSESGTVYLEMSYTWFGWRLKTVGNAMAECKKAAKSSTNKSTTELRKLDILRIDVVENE